MAKTREQKEAAVAELTDLLSTSKLTVAAKYSGLSVSDLQDLRHQSRDSATTVRVAKNRLVKLALSQVEGLKETAVASLEGQLLYAFNGDDEVAPAQVLAGFAKNHPDLTFVGAITSDGQFMSGEEVQRLADLPSKDQLRAQLVGTIVAPLSGFVNVMAGNLRGLVNVLNARAQELES